MKHMTDKRPMLLSLQEVSLTPV